MGVFKVHAYHFWFYCTIMIEFCRLKLTVYVLYRFSSNHWNIMCNIFAFKFKEFGNIHVVINCLVFGHKSYQGALVDPPNSLCKHCQQQNERERESKRYCMRKKMVSGERKKTQTIYLWLQLLLFLFFLSLQLWRFKQQHHAKHGKPIPSTNGLGFEWLGTQGTQE